MPYHPPAQHTPQSRATHVTWLLATGERLTTTDVARLTGLTRYGAWRLMQNVCLGAPVCYIDGLWQILRVDSSC